MKNIIICCDGTSNDISGAPTNVLRFYRSLERDELQLTYYDSGVGTLADPSMLTDRGKAMGKKIDMAIGSSVMAQTCKAYRFLTKHWEHGDKIFLIGFSRGSYAARALAGMIHALGLVRRELDHLDQLGWSVYSAADFQACSNFKYSFAREDSVKIHMAGVWDTVSSFGKMTSFKTLPHTSNNPSIAHVRHAVAIHEKRVCFKANLFRPKDLSQHASFKQIWFTGSHCDVGGGYPEEESGLAKVAFEWMYEETKDLGCRFNNDQIEFFLGRTDSKTFQCKPDPKAGIHNSIKGFWNLLEFIPRKQWNHDAKPPKMSWYFPNLYRARKIPNDAIFHESVSEQKTE